MHGTRVRVPLTRRSSARQRLEIILESEAFTAGGNESKRRNHRRNVQISRSKPARETKCDENHLHRLPYRCFRRDVDVFAVFCYPRKYLTDLPEPEAEISVRAVNVETLTETLVVNLIYSRWEFVQSPMLFMTVHCLWRSLGLLNGSHAWIACIAWNKPRFAVFDQRLNTLAHRDTNLKSSASLK